MSKTPRELLEKMPVGRAEAFVLAGLQQLGSKDFNAVANGKRRLTLENDVQIIAPTSKPDDTPIAIPYSRMLEIIGEKRHQIVAKREVLEDLFGIKSGEIPPIMVHEWELKRYVDTGHFFIYWPVDGLSMKDIYEKLIPQYKKRDWGKVLYDTDWYGNGKESFFISPISAGWMVFSLAPIPGTGGKNFLQQTEILKDFVCKRIYNRRQLPIEVKEAVVEFDKKKHEEIRLLIEGDKWQEGAKMLAGIKINKMFCPPSSAEALIFSAVVRAQTNQNIFEGLWSWTSALSRACALVNFGNSDSNGANVNNWNPRNSNPNLQRFSFRSLPRQIL